MSDLLYTDLQIRNATDIAKKNQTMWWVWFVLYMGLVGLITLYMILLGPDPIPVGALVGLAFVAVVFYRPRFGLNSLIFLSLLGDGVLMPWYPFNKNFSSRESILYISDALIFSPLELLLVLTLFSWIGKELLARRSFTFYKSELFRPLMVFSGFLVFGLLNGMATGGDMNIGLWEVRPIFYLISVVLITNNLLETREHVHQIMWLAMLAISIDAIAGIFNVFTLYGGNFSLFDRIQEHSASIHANTFFVLLIGVWLFKGSWSKRLILPFMFPPILFSYLANQRRAAFLTLGVALLLILVIYYKEHPKVARFTIPLFALLGLGYVLVFWNVGGVLGMPAQAVKSVLVASDPNDLDARSNEYRDLENINTSYTVHQKPITGIGFGNKFFIIAPMPDISFFVWWEYITHNSIIWMWMKTGVGGFMTMLYIIGTAIALGVRALWRLPNNDLSAMTLTATLYIIMHFIFAYVDISWDGQSMVYLGVMMGIVSSIEHIVAKPVPLPKKRWSWQPDPIPAPGLLN